MQIFNWYKPENLGTIAGLWHTGLVVGTLAVLLEVVLVRLDTCLTSFRLAVPCFWHWCGVHCDRCDRLEVPFPVCHAK